MDSPIVFSSKDFSDVTAASNSIFERFKTGRKMHPGAFKLKFRCEFNVTSEHFNSISLVANRAAVGFSSTKSKTNSYKSGIII